MDNILYISKTRIWHNSTTEQRFLAKLSKKKKNGCIEWKGWIHKHEGYGFLEINNEVISVHRYAYMLNSGRKIPKHLCVLHKCDNKICCNPKHLFLGTRTTNNKDRARKDRSFRQIGEISACAKFTNKEIKKIKKRLLIPYHGICADIAREYNVSITTISKIKTNVNWKNIT